MTGARSTWNGHCGRRRMCPGPSAMMQDKWYEQGEGEGPALLMHPSRSVAPGPHPVPMDRTSADRIRPHGARLTARQKEPQYRY